jgi:fermentation-respiration switch protein FrsA (DUF1100 family)
MANDDPTTPRTTVRISTPSGCAIEAWVNLPEGDGPYPAAVMAHGVGAVKAGGLQPFAERFRAEGFAAVVFDYRQWGGSDGEPRDELSVPRQLQDYSTVIDWTAAQPNIGSNRIVAWGTSFARQRPASRGMAAPLAPRRIERLSKVINPTTDTATTTCPARRASPAAGPRWPPAGATRALERQLHRRSRG